MKLSNELLRSLQTRKRGTIIVEDFGTCGILVAQLSRQVAAGQTPKSSRLQTILDLLKAGF